MIPRSVMASTPALELLNRVQARIEVRHRDRQRRGVDLLEQILNDPGVLRCAVEVARHGRLRGMQIGLHRAVVAREQRQPRAQQTQLHVLAHEVALFGRREHRVRVIDAAHLDERLQLLADVRREAAPPGLPARLARRRGRLPGARGGVGLRLRVRREHFARERQRVDLRDRVVELDRKPREIRRRRGLQPFDILRDRLAHDDRLRALRRREPRIGVLQRDQRELRVAREQQLLARARQHLTDFLDHPRVAVARQILILLLQRGLRGLRVGELAFELRQLRIGLAHARERLFGLRAELGRLRVERLLPLGRVLIEAVDLAVQRIAADARRGRDHDDHEPERRARRAAPLLRFKRRKRLIRRRNGGRGRFGRDVFGIVGVCHARRHRCGCRRLIGLVGQRTKRADDALIARAGQRNPIKTECARGLDDPRMRRDEPGVLERVDLRFVQMLVRELLQIAHALRARHEPRVRRARQQRVHALPRADRRLRAHAPIRGDELDFGARLAQALGKPFAAAVAAHDQHALAGELRLAVERTRDLGEQALGIVVRLAAVVGRARRDHAMRGRGDAVPRERGDAARPDDADRQRMRPDRAEPRERVIDRVRRHEHDERIRVEPRERFGERRVVGERRDVDERKVEHVDARRRELRRERRRLSVGAREHRGERARRARHHAPPFCACALAATSASTIARAPCRSSASDTLRPSASASAAVAARACACAASTRAPSVVDTLPVRCSSPPRHTACAASGTSQLPPSARDTARSASTASALA
ncbi:hypothetical protein BURPS1710b_1230 [Burkholderia pseudomallei 1710b]|uniref:Uncharacterized protein n=1 Tax=Burkholderia pseudomallei (strain 1710b) TaxID=320372 RepID=Q3JUW2_BURP1|nr:hypothetical protein BURPS1710b_1230 [Burkholderia pseudomallei 1710b]